MDAKRPTPRHIIIKMLNIKKRILKAAREKQLVTYRGVPIRHSADFSKIIYKLEGTGKKYSKSWKQGTTAKAALPSKAII